MEQMCVENSSGEEVKITISANVKLMYMSVVEMDPVIEKYCNAHA